MWLKPQNDPAMRLGSRLSGRLLVVFLLGVGLALGQPPVSLWPLALLSLLAVFWLETHQSLNASLRQAFGRGWSLGMGYFTVSMHWIVEPFLVDSAAHGWMAPFALLLFAGGLSVFWGCAFALALRLQTPFGLAFALGFFELARGYMLTGFPWGALGYIWADTPVAQSAAWIGLYGLSVITVFWAACVHWLFLRKQIFWMVLVLVGVWPVAWIGGDMRLTTQKSALTEKMVRLVQPNAPQHQKWDPVFARLFFERSLEFTAAEPSVDLVVWPESALPVSFENAETLIEQIALAADGTALLLGALRLENEKVLNSIVYMDQNGVAEVVYDKHHLVPFGEYLPFERWLDRIGLGFTSDLFGTGFAAGEGPKRINIAPLGAIVPLICYEAVFPQDVSFASQEAAVLLQLTNDAWFGAFAGPQQHLAQAKMRSIEQGLPMIRVANTGISAMIDPYGRSLKQLGLNTAGFIDAQVPQPAPATLYRRFEIWTVFALLFAILMLSLICRRQNSN